MRRRPIVLLLIALFLTTVATVPVAADSTPLLSESNTTSILPSGTVTYDPAGTLTLTAPDAAGAAAAVDVAIPFQLDQKRYVQVSVTATAPFNIALRLESDTAIPVHPQIAAPGWYEAFQAEKPAAGDGIAPGTYVLSLDLQAYMVYNDLEIPSSGYFTLKNVYITLKDAGTVTIDRLMLSDTGEFQTASGKTGTTAKAPTAVTTAANDVHITTHPTYDAGGVAQYRGNDSTATVMTLLILAAVLVLLMILMTVLKKRRSHKE